MEEINANVFDELASNVLDLPHLSFDETSLVLGNLTSKPHLYFELNSFSTEVLNYQINTFVNSHTHMYQTPYYLHNAPPTQFITPPEHCQNLITNDTNYYSPASSPDYCATTFSCSQPPPQQIASSTKGLKCVRKMTRKRESGSKIGNDLTMAEVEKIRHEFKQKRVRLGLSQKQAADVVARTVRKTSQTSLCRCENNQLHTKNMISLAPFLKQWVQMDD